MPKSKSQFTRDETIKEIDEKSIQFIAAGEKISDVETVVRELVENSIDAQSKVIEVRLTKYGLDSIEVEDNGLGIEESNFSSLGQRYHTSKISDHRKLEESLETFGFRGEALHCLCNIASVTIVTKAKSSSTGTKLTFDKNGRQVKKERAARSDGTTVIVKDLFHSMPVRKRDLEMTCKRQYDRVTKLLYEEVLARPEIKITLARKHSCKKEKDFTHGGASLESNIISIFGIKVLESLAPIKQIGSEISPQHQKDTVITKPGSDTSNSSDSLPKNEIISKSMIKSNGNSVIDESSSSVKDFETTVAPPREGFFNRKISTRASNKRRVPFYTIYGYISKIGQGRHSNDCQFIFVNNKPCEIPRVSRLINEIFRSYSPNQSPFYCLFVQVQSWAADFNVPRKRTVILRDENLLNDIIKDSLNEMYSPYKPGSQTECSTAKLPFMTNNNVSEEKVVPIKLDNKREFCQSSDTCEGAPPIKKKATELGTMQTNPLPVIDEEHAKDDVANHVSIEVTDVRASGSADTVSHMQNQTDKMNDRSSITLADTCRTACEPPTGFVSALDCLNMIQNDRRDKPTENGDGASKNPVLENVICNFRQSKQNHEGSVKVQLENCQDLQLAMERERNQRAVCAGSKEFLYAIHPSFNSVAEDELKLNLNKDSFKQMQILGQFNKGFILTRLDKHVFIIDQHATDERANYEDQIEKSPLVKQTMVHPKPLYLNSIQENAIMNNLSLFQEKGFDFAIDESKLTGLRVQLSSTSICKGQGMDECLTKEDVEELIDVVLESPNRAKTYILKKVKEVAASRACRKSVMIGDDLTWNKMTDIVTKMSHLKNPWVCAHNRPTIRHLMDVDWMSK